MGMCLQEFHETGEYAILTAAACGRLQEVAFGKAPHQDVS
jgi:hypothetical protein